MTISVLQTNLQRMGLYDGAIDGDPGPKTWGGAARALSGNAVPDGTGNALVHAVPASFLVNPLRAICLLANIATECDFTLVSENLNYSPERLVAIWPSRFGPGKADPALYAHNPEALANLVYAGRMGNEKPGDGWMYRGRSWPQLTGRSMYDQIGEKLGYDLLGRPDDLLQVDLAARATVAFWSVKMITPLVDSGDLQAVRERWNGGSNGMSDFLDSVAKLKRVWGIA